MLTAESLMVLYGMRKMVVGQENVYCMSVSLVYWLYDLK